MFSYEDVDFELREEVTSPALSDEATLNLLAEDYSDPFDDPLYNLLNEAEEEEDGEPFTLRPVHPLSHCDDATLRMMYNSQVALRDAAAKLYMQHRGDTFLQAQQQHAAKVREIDAEMFAREQAKGVAA